ncbi:beta-citrylglutamate synthase B-like [Pelodytes ibericus]
MFIDTCGYISVFQSKDRMIWLLSNSTETQKETYQQLNESLQEQCAAVGVSYEAIAFKDLIMSVEMGCLNLYLKGRPISSYPQIVYFRGHTPALKMDEGITVLRHLEKMGCRVVNGLQSMLRCINKFWTLQELAGHGIPVPDSLSYGGYSDLEGMIELGEEQLSFPLVVKNTRGCQGTAVFLAMNKVHLMDIQHVLRKDNPYLLQKYVKESHGLDVRVMVIGGNVVASVKRVAQGGRLQCNFSRGSVHEIYPLGEGDRNLVKQVVEVLGMDICTIDFLIREDGSLCVCEVNSNPGFIYLNMDIPSLITKHLISLLPKTDTVN